MSGTDDDHRISELERKVEHHQAEIELIKKSAPARWAKIGVFLGAFAALIAVGRGGADLYQWLTRSPQLTSVAGHNLSLEYQPQKKQVTFRFNGSLANSGQAANVIDSVAGRLSVRNNTAGSAVYFPAQDFQCFLGSLDGAKVSIPLSLQPGVPVTVACSISEYAPEQARKSLLGPNEQQLTITLYGLKKTITQLEYCFMLPDDAISEASHQSSQSVQRRFIDAKCD